jgi:peptide chain release factor subunit 3
LNSSIISVFLLNFDSSDEIRFNECKNKLIIFLKNSGYNPKDTIFIPISALNCKNINKLDDIKWWTGPYFLEALDNLPKIHRNNEGSLRIPIISKYKDMGTIIEGKIEQGTVNIGDKLYVMPNKIEVEVSNLWENENEVNRLYCGNNSRLRLKDISDEEIQVGFVISCKKNICPVIQKLEVTLIIIELLEHKPIFTAGYTSIIHIHSASEDCSIIKINSLLDKKTRKIKKKNPIFARNGDVIICIIELQQSTCMEIFENCNQLGRFTLRDEGITIAIGKIKNFL